ncbi:MAG: hypothetical protein QXT19_04230 [Candidatus Woesearchaeota archaeon]
MERIDFNKIRKMPPDRRIKALEEIQEELDKFIKEKTKEIEESQQEIKDAQDFLKEAKEELQVLEEMQAEAPRIKKIDVEKLFEPQKKKGGKELEDIAEEAPKTAAAASEQEAYITMLAHQPIANIYERIRAIGDEIRTTGTISPYQQEKLDQFYEALKEKEQAIKAGEYVPGKKAEHLLTAAERAIMYARGQ